ncbi:histidine--tRNA ligase [Candidatus Phytoplasma mali]|uniref:histidine--tRNA ligase n=1 Tax=Apple proliferation phytoplasma TaxID=37692 RepID=UPI003B9696AC
MIKKPKGTYDLLFDEISQWQELEKKVKFFFENYNYLEIRTPIIEYNEIFNRTATHSDMVNKEIYNFYDKKGRLIALRPEGTAGVVRSYIENKLDFNENLNKFYYLGSFFRYERPQKGRYRQFHQIGVEVLGDNTPFLDLEVIATVSEMLIFLGLKDFKIIINTLGDESSYKKYIKVFNDYIKKQDIFLCSLCKERLKKNSLRILDCKTCAQKNFLKSVPLITDYLNDFSKQRFDSVIKGLKFMKINFQICPHLVRGLDYYNHTVFEIILNSDSIGKRNSLGGGGCYDRLVEILGGHKTSGIGFALGTERLISVLKKYDLLEYSNNNQIDVYFLFLDSKLFFKSLFLVNQLRNAGIKTEINYRFLPFLKQLKKALKYNPKYFVILGEKEDKNNEISIKNTINQNQKKLSQLEMIKFLKKELDL